MVKRWSSSQAFPPWVLMGLLTIIALPSAAIPAEEKGREAESEVEDAEDRPRFTDRIEVKARADDLVGIASSGTEGVTGRADLARRPKLRVGEVLETVPGMIATQHSGGGKGNQYYLRGFNLDHGTDFRITVEGMQVNLPTHAHGQGYADLNFMIPDLIETVRFRKGPYYANTGDFSAAGSTDIEYVRSLPEGILEATGGDFGFQRALAAGSHALGSSDLLGAVEYSHYDGPWERPDHFRRLNALVKYSRGGADDGLSLTAMAYEGEWDATDQIPERAVERGIIDRFGLLDEDLGGKSSRYSLSGEIHRRRGKTWTRLDGYLLTYDLDLLSNFTYNLDDPSDDARIDGDQFLQSDDRAVAGARFRQERIGAWRERATTVEYGAEIRYDTIDNGLFSTRGGVPESAFREDAVDQYMSAAWIQGDIQWSGFFRSLAGLRADLYRVDVESDLDRNSGKETDSIASPKLSLVLGPWHDTEYYLNLGYGYHSNDARGATLRVDPQSLRRAEPVDPLVRARGADLGFRTAILPGLHSSVSFFVLELDSELLFVGDAGGTEAGRPSRRSGVELVNFYRVRDWLSLDLDLAFTDATFTDDDPAGDRIPGSIEQAVAAGVSVEGAGGWFGSLRWRYFGPRPLVEDDSVRSGSTSLLNFRAGYGFGGRVDLALEVFNLTNREDNDIAYFYRSRLPGEPLQGVEEIHFHPMEERSFRIQARWKL